MRFYYVYILHNPKKNFIYIGYTENLKERVKYHNLGKVKSTKPYLPLNLIHYEAYITKSDAKRRERYLKTNRGKTSLMTMLKDYFVNIRVLFMDMKPDEKLHSNSLKITGLTSSHWRIYRDIRLKGLKKEPQAFARSFEEEKKYPKEKWLERVNNPYNVVAIKSGRALGTMSAYVTEEKNVRLAHVVGVFVTKEARGKGIGSKLLAAVLEKIKKDKSIKKIDLTVNKEQVPAVKLYEKFGFQIVGEESQKMGDENEHIEYRMELTL